MTWLNIISLALKAVTGFVTFLRERMLIKAGEDKAKAEASEMSNARVRKAQEARRGALNDGTDPDDPYLRD